MKTFTDTDLASPCPCQARPWFLSHRLGGEKLLKSLAFLLRRLCVLKLQDRVEGLPRKGNPWKGPGTGQGVTAARNVEVFPLYKVSSHYSRKHSSQQELGGANSSLQTSQQALLPCSPISAFSRMPSWVTPSAPHSVSCDLLALGSRAPSPS